MHQSRLPLPDVSAGCTAEPDRIDRRRIKCKRDVGGGDHKVAVGRPIQRQRRLKIRRNSPCVTTGGRMGSVPGLVRSHRLSLRTHVGEFDDFVSDRLR